MFFIVFQEMQEDRNWMYRRLLGQFRSSLTSLKNAQELRQMYEQQQKTLKDNELFQSEVQELKRHQLAHMDEMCRVQQA